LVSVTSKSIGWQVMVANPALVFSRQTVPHPVNPAMAIVSAADAMIRDVSFAISSFAWLWFFGPPGLRQTQNDSAVKLRKAFSTFTVALLMQTVKQQNCAGRGAAAAPGCARPRAQQASTVRRQ
jgi:hypothetical protein